MRPRIRTPRLLPMTIVALTVVLGTKLTVLVRTVIDSGQPAALFTAAWASGPDAPVPPEKSAAKPGAKPGDCGQQIKPQGGAEIKPAAAEQPVAATVPEGPPPMTEAEKTLLLDLRQRRQELDAREATLASRESMLAAAQQKLSTRIEELQTLQKRLEGLDTSHRQQEDAAWQGLVKVYESMKPPDAAVIFNELGMPVLLAVVGRMKEARAASVLAAMLPDKARDVTMQLALLRTRPAGSVDAAETPTVPLEPAKPAGSGT